MGTKKYSLNRAAITKTGAQRHLDFISSLQGSLRLELLQRAKKISARNLNVHRTVLAFHRSQPHAPERVVPATRS